MSWIYSRFCTRIESIFKTGSCILCILALWLTYTDDCRANAMLRPLRGMWGFARRGDSAGAKIYAVIKTNFVTARMKWTVCLWRRIQLCEPVTNCRSELPPGNGADTTRPENSSDQTCSCPRDWRLSAPSRLNWEPIWNTQYITALWYWGV